MSMRYAASARFASTDSMLPLEYRPENAADVAGNALTEVGEILQRVLAELSQARDVSAWKHQEVALRERAYRWHRRRSLGCGNHTT